MIHVKENTDTFLQEKPSDETPCDIVAEKDGMITSIITRKGVPLVKPGDFVKAGDMLVSGTVEVKNDAGEIINYHQQISDADITAETTISYMEEVPSAYFEKQYTDAQKNLFYIKLGKYRCTFGSVKNKYPEFEQVSVEKQCRIGEHFDLPISYGTEKVRAYKSQKKVYTKNELQILLSTNFETYCKKLEAAEKKIVAKDVHVSFGKTSGKASGTIRVQEKLGEHVESALISGDAL